MFEAQKGFRSGPFSSKLSSITAKEAKLDQLKDADIKSAAQASFNTDWDIPAMYDYAARGSMFNAD